MLYGPIGTWEPEEAFDTDLAIIPDVVIQDESVPAEQALRPLFDLAGNGGGWARSPSYDPVTGERKKPR